MRYICTNCNFIYDDNIWIPEEGIAPQSFFIMGENFVCPSCFWEKDWMYELSEEIIYFENIDNLSELESLYYPNYVIDKDKKVLSISFSELDSHNWALISKVVLLDEYNDIIDISSDCEDEISFDISTIDSFKILIHSQNHWLFSTWLINID